MVDYIDSVKGSFYGSAVGDGLGSPTEFLSMEDIKTRFGSEGIAEPLGDPILVTDDTQMAIAVGKAVMDSCETARPLSPSNFEEHLRKRFVEWLHSPDNNRAPGMTCLDSCENLDEGMDWIEAANKSSKGYGANMRVHPIAYAKFKDLEFTETDIAKWSQFQAAITHGHATALASAELTAITVSRLIEGSDPDDLLRDLIDYAETQTKIYHADYLGNLWQRPGVTSPEDFISRGWVETISALEKVQEALWGSDIPDDPCAATGAGWVAEEALATALYCFLLDSSDPETVLCRAANTSGDSDSIACLAGAFVGAYNGYKNLPVDWVNRIEYKNEIDAFVSFVGGGKIDG